MKKMMSEIFIFICTIILFAEIFAFVATEKISYIYGIFFLTVIQIICVVFLMKKNIVAQKKLEKLHHFQKTQ